MKSRSALTVVVVSTRILTTMLCVSESVHICSTLVGEASLMKRFMCQVHWRVEASGVKG